MANSIIISEQKGDTETDKPRVGGGASQDDRADLVRDRAKGVAGFDDGRASIWIGSSII